MWRTNKVFTSPSDDGEFIPADPTAADAAADDDAAAAAEEGGATCEPAKMLEGEALEARVRDYVLAGEKRYRAAVRSNAVRAAPPLASSSHQEVQPADTAIIA